MTPYNEKLSYIPEIVNERIGYSNRIFIWQKRWGIGLAILLMWSFASAQTHYNVSWGNSTYDTLSNLYATRLNPLLVDSQGVAIASEIEFGFNFPFFSKMRKSVYFELDGHGHFDGSPEFNLMMFTGDYSISLTGDNVYRDWRYQKDTVNGVQVLKVEWRNASISEDLHGSRPTEHKINYQVWFYEKGAIEIHFGEVDLVKSPFYIDTAFTKRAGFIDSDGDSYGPWLGIANFDESRVYYASGTSANPFVITDNDDVDILYKIPSYGRYFRWEPVPTGVEKTNSKLHKNTFNVFPNPTDSYLTLNLGLQEIESGSINIYNSTGQLIRSIGSFSTNQRISLLDLPAGLYTISITDSSSRVFTKRVLKY